MAQIQAFGHSPADASLSAFGRPAAWRVRGAVIRLVATLILAPLVAIIPPHAPWVVAVLITGLIFTRRRWTEKLTVTAFEGDCPKCGSALSLAPGTRLLNPHALTCESCHHSLSLTHSPATS